jgi:hypothetical protein
MRKIFAVGESMPVDFAWLVLACYVRNIRNECNIWAFIFFLKFHADAFGRTLKHLPRLVCFYGNLCFEKQREHDFSNN